METKQLLESFFEEQFKNTSQFFLYKDKKLLKEEKYVEFAQEQLKKARQIFWSVAGSLLLACWYGITSLIGYGGDPNWFDLSAGLILWFSTMGMVWYTSKEYYSIKSSMNLFIKMMEKEQVQKRN
ncbi:MAG: hypothetical protein WD357_12060 [Gracilimonas sp.]